MQEENSIRIIKEFCQGDIDKLIVLRSRYYRHDLPYFDKLVAEATNDFPHIQRHEIEIVHYAGERYARTFGIEFSVSNDVSIPDSYAEISSAERTY